MHSHLKNWSNKNKKQEPDRFVTLSVDDPIRQLFDIRTKFFDLSEHRFNCLFFTRIFRTIVLSFQILEFFGSS